MEIVAPAEAEKLEFCLAFRDWVLSFFPPVALLLSLSAESRPAVGPQTISTALPCSLPIFSFSSSKSTPVAFLAILEASTMASAVMLMRRYWSWSSFW